MTKQMILMKNFFMHHDVNVTPLNQNFQTHVFLKYKTQLKSGQTTKIRQFIDFATLHECRNVQKLVDENTSIPLDNVGIPEKLQNFYDKNAKLFEPSVLFKKENIKRPPVKKGAMKALDKILAEITYDSPETYGQVDKSMSRYKRMQSKLGELDIGKSKQKRDEYAAMHSVVFFKVSSD